MFFTDIYPAKPWDKLLEQIDEETSIKIEIRFFPKTNKI